MSANNVLKSRGPSLGIYRWKGRRIGSTTEFRILNHRADGFGENQVDIAQMKISKDQSDIILESNITRNCIITLCFHITIMSIE